MISLHRTNLRFLLVPVVAASFAFLSLDVVADTSAKTSSKSSTQRDAVSSEKTDRIIATLRARFPDLKFDRATASADWPGLYEVISGDELIYTNEDGSRLLTGKMFDTETRQDLTAQRWNEINKIKFDDLPLQYAIKTVRGNGSRRFAVFADPDCPYCKQLEENIKDVSDVTIYTFLYPLQSLHHEAYQKAVKIWCSKDRVESWSNWMRTKTLPANEGCVDHPVVELIKLGESLKIDSTPTMFFTDGRRHSGSIKSEVLEQRLAASRSEK